jgi:RNA polymerase sigma-70 factor, ECF subfamily
MDAQEWLAQGFETNRPHLRAVAYRMLGSLAEADDAVQEAWLRLSRSGGAGIENLGGWLTTVVARVSLDLLRAGARNRWPRTCPTRSSAARTPPTPSTRRWWPTGSGWRCWWCWTP